MDPGSNLRGNVVSVPSICPPLGWKHCHPNQTWPVPPTPAQWEEVSDLDCTIFSRKGRRVCGVSDAYLPVWVLECWSGLSQVDEYFELLQSSLECIL